MEYITSKENTNIVEYMKLKNLKKIREKLGLFIIEGKKILLEAISSNIIIEKIFISDRIDLKDEIFKYIDNVLCVKYCISSGIEKKIADTVSPQGFYAVCKKRNHDFLDFIPEEDRKIYLIIDNLQNPGNLGTIIRLSEAMAVSKIYISNNCCDIYSSKVIRSSMGSNFRVEICFFDDIISLIKLMKENKIKILGSCISDSSVDIRNYKPSESVCIIIGNEGNGLDSIVLDQCDILVEIPMSGPIESLNVSLATSILLWEIKNKI